LTDIRLQHYSDGMISDFDQLYEKIRQLAEMTQSLRSENAELRVNAAALVNENADLSKRMKEAHQRVSVLLANMPVTEQDEETE